MRNTAEPKTGELRHNITKKEQQIPKHSKNTKQKIMKSVGTDITFSPIPTDSDFRLAIYAKIVRVNTTKDPSMPGFSPTTKYRIQVNIILGNKLA
jgi:hypothetical protein